MSDDQTDYFTVWKNLLDHVACPDIVHQRENYTLYSRFTYDFNGCRSAFHTRRQNAKDSNFGGDFQAAIGDLIVMCGMLSNMVNVTKEATLDCRLAAIGASMTAEEIFDLWLDRASEIL